MIVTASDGTRLSARRTGAGTPVVLVHGSAGGLGSFDPIVPLLADRFELWTYARRGYAPSDVPDRPKTYADDVADLRAVLDAVGRPAHVVGVSYGATVALHAAPIDGRIVLFEPALFAAGPAMPLDSYRKLVEAGDLTGAARLFAGEVARVPAEMLAGITAMPLAEAVGCLHDLEAMAADSPDLSRWSGVRENVLLMQGSDSWDPLPATMDALAAPGWQRAVLAGQSHFATHTAPELFASTVAEFLA
ncbi:alpha/beta hydrolase [Actinoplanes bogorensis]|uniref:Alpha/beta hydrolase n=1 Tax=Paractinoplanes bogorensis TaxID=1610840 RepID=A0ABS5YYA2_9ACTN|nr:alpha/beta fold hydrolase [Actinoplanes bogorensis]MBU2668435.1 alpha/beta hydrolase [Actinoplanes bogorensis]